MSDLYKELKSIFGIRRLTLLIISFTASLVIGSNHYKSLIESIFKLQSKDLNTLKNRLLEIEFSHVIIFLTIFLLLIFLFKTLNKISIEILIDKTSLRKSIENIVASYQFEKANLKEIIEAQEYKNKKLNSSRKEFENIYSISESLFVIGFFLLISSIYCGILDFAIGLTLVITSFLTLFNYQLNLIRISPKYISADILIDKKSLDKSISNFFEI